MKSDVQRLVEQVKANGFDVEQTRRGGHLLVKQEGKVIASIPSTPSDWRWLENQKSQLRRQGVLPPKGEEVFKRDRAKSGVTSEQLRVAGRLRAFFNDSGISQMEFSRHMLDIAEQQKMRPPSTPQAARRVLYRILNDDSDPVADWLVSLMDVTLVDIESLPPKVKEEGMAPPLKRNMTGTERMLKDLYGMSVRAGRTLPHGMKSVIGQIVREQLRREHDLSLLDVVTPKGTRTLEYDQIGNRITDAWRGAAHDSRTTKLMEAFDRAIKAKVHTEAKFVTEPPAGPVLSWPTEVKPEPLQRTTAVPPPYDPDKPKISEALATAGKPVATALNGKVPLSMQVLAKLAYAAGDKQELDEAIDIATQVAVLEA